MANNREALNNRLLALISSMEQEGMADHRLAEARELKEITSPFFFAELVPTFSSDAFNTLRELNAALAKTDLDFHHLGELLHENKRGHLMAIDFVSISRENDIIGKGRSVNRIFIQQFVGWISIGACRMAHACVRLSQAIDERSKDGCMNAFEILKNEYLVLHAKLDKIVELERMILSHETDD